MTHPPRNVTVFGHHERFKYKSTIGLGTFGGVFLATDTTTGSDVAIKKVCLDPRYKSRELDVVQQLAHPNCLSYICHYTTNEGAKNEVFLHLVTSYLPVNLQSYVSAHVTNDVYVKVFGFQLFAALAYLHDHGVCHRDIKPSNVLIDPGNGCLQLCDFGSAKFLKPGEVSVSYIATRSYRAPELLVDCPSYTPAIDVWAAGCVLSEMYLQGKALFAGGSNSEVQLAIGKILGDPGPHDFDGFTHKKKWPLLGNKNGQLAHVLPKRTPKEFVDLLSTVFVYAPEQRATAAQCMGHPFFAGLFQPGVLLPNRMPLPEYLGKIGTVEQMRANFPTGPTAPA
jgi:glycogen synthase kinase 3 beta